MIERTPRTTHCPTCGSQDLRHKPVKGTDVCKTCHCEWFNRNGRIEIVRVWWEERLGRYDPQAQAIVYTEEETVEIVKNMVEEMEWAYGDIPRVRQLKQWLAERDKE
jgi:hypothetical protein